MVLEFLFLGLVLCSPHSVASSNAGRKTADRFSQSEVSRPFSGPTLLTRECFHANEDSVEHVAGEGLVIMYQVWETRWRESDEVEYPEKSPLRATIY